MARRTEYLGAIGRSLFCLVSLLVLLSVAAGCAAPPWEAAVDSPRYDIAHAVWLVSRIRAGADLPGPVYVALYNRAEEALSATELDRMVSVFACLEREQIYSLLARIDPRNDDWLTAGDESCSEGIDLMRLAWDRFLRDWDAHNWQAMRESALIRWEKRLWSVDNPFKLVLQLLDVSLPKPHVLFYMPSALGDPPSGVSSDNRIYRVDAGYVLTGNADRTHAVTEHALLASWLGGEKAEETLLQMARHWSGWEYVSLRSSREHILTQARDRVFWILEGAVMVKAGVFPPAYLELHGSIFEQDWPGLSALLVRRVNEIWQTHRKLMEDDVLEVMRTWLAQNP